MGPAAAILAPQVADLLKSSNQDVRVAAAEALERWARQRRVLRPRWPIC